jgi:ornithine decarboxylase
MSFRGCISSTFYAISQRRVNQQMTLWRSKLPLVKPYYAVKCNPDPSLIAWLTNRGAGFDCASVREIKAVKRIDKKADIVFANPCKKREEILSEPVTDVNVTVVDSHEEIDKLDEIKYNKSSYIRIRVDDCGSAMPFSAKFGADPHSVKELAEYAKLKKQTITGISFHVGSGCKQPIQYKNAIEDAYECLNHIKEAGHGDANTIDIGGGFMTEGFHEAAEVIRNARYELPWEIKMIAEPGRFFAASCQDLFVRVIGKKAAARGKKGWRYTLDESLYGQFSCIPFDHARPRWIRIRGVGEEKRASAPAVLYGRTCDSVDFIAAAEEAEELMEGDWLWFPHMGAYTTVTSTEFNGFPKPPMLQVENGMLPEIADFQESDWPRGLKYVGAVKVPDIL